MPLYNGGNEGTYLTGFLYGLSEVTYVMFIGLHYLETCKHLVNMSHQYKLDCCMNIKSSIMERLSFVGLNSPQEFPPRASLATHG